MIYNIPEEMRLRPQWVMWKYEAKNGDRLTKVPYQPFSGKHASPIDVRTWASFDQCAEILYRYPHFGYNGIGYVFAENDPYAFLDFDFPSNADESEKRRIIENHMKVYNQFPTYSELSPSGLGAHVIMRNQADLPAGRRRSGIELYSKARFATMTGNILNNLPINDCTNQLMALYAQMGRGVNITDHLIGLSPQLYSDEEIIRFAYYAANGEKFAYLYNGQWQYFYPSQSEADFALVDILFYYSKNAAQTKRIFEASELGKRLKATRPDYVDQMILKAADRTLPPLDEQTLNVLSGLVEQVLPTVQVVEPEITEADSGIECPPGLVGQIAQYIYAQAVRPVPEIAIAGAIGMMAGIVGRSHNISDTGLNLYVLLLAKTGTGKEAISSGINKLMSKVGPLVPRIWDFMGPAEIASHPAIHKYLCARPSIVSIVGEYGEKLQIMTHPKADTNSQSLKRFLLDIYGKSGKGNNLGAIIYSDDTKSTKPIASPALSIIGESVPETFFKGLRAELISTGFLPRFLIIEYDGNRVPMNDAHADVEPSNELINSIAELAESCLTLNSRGIAVKIETTPEAKAFFKEFNEYCDSIMNKKFSGDVIHQLWNRAYLKLVKLSGIVAVGCNAIEPVVTLEIAQWAEKIVKRDITRMVEKFENGDVIFENEEAAQLAKTKEVIRDFLTKDWDRVKSYIPGFSQEFHIKKVVPYNYIHSRLHKLKQFHMNPRINPTFAIRQILNLMCDKGDLVEIPKHEVLKYFHKRTIAYAIETPETFKKE